MHTPWGTADYVKELAPGITLVGTPSHGGIRVAPEQNRQIHKALRNESGTAVGGGRAGWYEEDCEWAIVAMQFPEAFVRPLAEGDKTDWSTPEKVREIAVGFVKNYSPDGYEAATGETIPEGESYLKDKRLFEERHQHDWVVTCAFGSHLTVPDGMVGVIAQQASSGRKIGFLVPKDEYHIPSVGGFICDLDRHEPWDGPRGEFAPKVKVAG
jgi:hypothetical protein